MKTPPPTISETLTIDCSPEQLYAVYAAVADWPRWDPDTRQARLDGPLAVGSRGMLKPGKGLPVRMQVMHAEPGRRLTVVCPVLGSRMHFEHLITPLPGQGCRATHTVRFEGWLANWLDRTVGRQVREGLPRTMQSLKRYVESGQGPAQRASVPLGPTPA